MRFWLICLLVSFSLALNTASQYRLVRPDGFIEDHNEVFQTDEDDLELKRSDSNFEDADEDDLPERRDYEDIEGFLNEGQKGDFDEDSPSDSDIYSLYRVETSIHTIDVSGERLVEDTDDEIIFDDHEDRAQNRGIKSLLEVSDENAELYNINTNSNLANNGQSQFIVSSELSRDKDDLADDVDDDGDDPSEGETVYLLVTSFVSGEKGTGLVWAVPEDEDDKEDAYVLISGLNNPTGVCFDINNDFLYVVDPGHDEKGYIFQYEVSWDDDGDEFRLSSQKYAVVYEGSVPFDCTVDEYGNLFFVERTYDQVNMINYMDLWAGISNQHYTLYDGRDDNGYVSKPVSLEVYESDDLYVVNNEDGRNSGVLVKGDAESNFLTQAELKPLAKISEGGWGVAVSDDYVYFTTKEGNVWVMDSDDESELEIKTRFFIDPKGICYGDDEVYVVDRERGQIYVMDDDNDEEEEPELYLEIQNAYDVFCVNGAYGLTVAMAVFIYSILL
jgi:sugar lactone lactonase YvrE